MDVYIEKRDEPFGDFRVDSPPVNKKLKKKKKRPTIIQDDGSGGVDTQLKTKDEQLNER